MESQLALIKLQVNSPIWVLQKNLKEKSKGVLSNYITEIDKNCKLSNFGLLGTQPHIIEVSFLWGGGHVIKKLVSTTEKQSINNAVSRASF